MAVISTLAPPLTIATALLYYFGWARASAQADAMGLDVSLFGYSPQDFVLRSITALYTPLVGILVVAVVWLAVDRWLHGWAHGSPKRRALTARIAIGAVVVGMLMAVLSPFFGIWQAEASAIFVPYITAAGVLLSWWGVRIRRQVNDRRTSGLLVEQQAVEVTLMLSLVTLLLFWGTADFAQAVGRRLAVNYETSVSALPQAEIYSEERLTIGASAVHEEQVGTPAAPVYRYRGLRLLVLSGERFFFLHDGWTREDGTVIVIPDDNRVRMEFRN